MQAPVAELHTPVVAVHARHTTCRVVDTCRYDGGHTSVAVEPTVCVT